MVFAVGALLLAGWRVFTKGHATASTASVTSFPIKPKSFSFLAAAIGIAAAGSVLFGYLALGWFLSVQLLWIATLFCVTYVVWAALNRLQRNCRHSELESGVGRRQELADARPAVNRLPKGTPDRRAKGTPWEHPFVRLRVPSFRPGPCMR